MEKKIMQSNAIDLLNKLIAKKPQKVQEIIEFSSNTDIDGPTYEEYLSSLHEHSILNNCSVSSEVEVDYMRIQSAYIDIPLTFEVEQEPPILIKTRKRKKDSVISQSLFFYIILYNVRSKKSRI
ncbi:hypothetical protein [Flavobacterium sp.]|uniref:hypothetical protein n=1 Tax=Flavobacterium sp. TaxID=239 RepID=UPI0022BC7017|nr:hypothetical protein [Flavobacterium sp.]MCZ8145834.1 hypothetical protein [Flavobacterium sp.]MCZ8366420.1 hypothetical protein [Flavobacterium sp.]